MELAKLTSGDVGRSLIMVREGLRMDGSPSGHSVTINITGLKAFSDAVKQAQVSVAQLGKTLNGLAVKSAIIDEFHVGGFHEDDGEDDDGRFYTTFFDDDDDDEGKEHAILVR